MKYIIKNSSPHSLELYKREEGACFNDMPKPIKDEVRDSLFKEQGGICCYCGKSRVIYYFNHVHCAVQWHSVHSHGAALTIITF